VFTKHTGIKYKIFPWWFHCEYNANNREYPDTCDEVIQLKNFDRTLGDRGFIPNVLKQVIRASTELKGLKVDMIFNEIKSLVTNSVYNRWRQRCKMMKSLPTPNDMDIVENDNQPDDDQDNENDETNDQGNKSEEHFDKPTRDETTTTNQPTNEPTESRSRQFNQVINSSHELPKK